MNVIDTTACFIIKTLKHTLNGDYGDMQRILTNRHYIESIFITLLNAKKLGLPDNYPEILAQMSDYGLLSEDIRDFGEEYREVIQRGLPSMEDSGRHTPSLLHEGILTRELHISPNNDVCFSVGKASRNTTSSYYTPNDFAMAVIHEAVGQYLKTRRIKTRSDAVVMLSQVRFADFSCGCGEFFKAILRYLGERYDIPPKTAAMNFYGIDIDPIALQIAVCDLLEISDRNNWRTIISHFVLGNPLIDRSCELGVTEKVRLFAQKRYYANGMGIDMNRFCNSARVDIVVGNPPWEKIRIEERKLFKPIVPSISEIAQKHKRQLAIEALETEMPECHAWYRKLVSDIADFKKSLQQHPYIKLTQHGELNTCNLFTELSMNQLVKDGVLSLIVKSALITSPANKVFFGQIMGGKHLTSVCLYTNALRMFNIDSREKFCVITCAKNNVSALELLAGAEKSDDMHTFPRTVFTAEDIGVINPHTQMLPNISSTGDFAVLLDAHRRLPLFDTAYPNCHFGRLVHLTAHASQITTEPNAASIPIYEGKFIEQYDGRFATFAGIPKDKRYTAKVAAAKIPAGVAGHKALPESRYFIDGNFWRNLSKNFTQPYTLYWRSLTNITNARTSIATILPHIPSCQSLQLLQTESPEMLLLLLALFNSAPFDYFVRMKLSGIDLTQTCIRQIPVPPLGSFECGLRFQGTDNPVKFHIFDRIHALYADENRLQPLFDSIGYSFPLAITNRNKKTLMAEIDRLIAITYEMPADILRTVANTFPGFYTKEEVESLF